MAAKILLCVALCFTLTQVSLARPDQVLYGYQTEVAETRENSSACQESLQNAQQQLQELTKLTDKVKIELLEAYKKGIICLKNQDVLSCLTDVLKESVGNFMVIESRFRSTLNELIKSVSTAIKNCMGQGFILLIRALVPLALEYVY